MTTERRVQPCRTETRPATEDRCGKTAPYDGARRWPALVAVLFVGLLQALPAAACPVCYGEAGGDVIDGAKLSILFLGGLVYVVIGGGAGVVLALRRRVRKNLDRRHGLHLVAPPGANQS